VNRGNPSFSLDDFKNWLSKEADLSEFFALSSRMGSKPGDELIGREVYAKVSPKKLLEKIKPEEGDPETLVEELVENGGMILSLNGKDLLIEVDSGSFLMPRFCVRLVKAE
jgi:hypothetical protein